MDEKALSMDVYINRLILEAEPDAQALAKDQAMHSASIVFKANGWLKLRKLRAGSIWQCPGEDKCGYSIDARAVLHAHITVTALGVKADV